MKRIISFVMSVLLAASAFAMPAAAEPAVPDFNAEWAQARPVSAEELAQVRSEKIVPVEDAEADTQSLQYPVSSTITEEVLTFAQGTAVNSEAKAEQPVPVQITASTVTLEYHEGYEYRIYQGIMSGSWKETNIFKNLGADQYYICQQRLAGKPETESAPLWIRTKERTPCSITPAAPIVKVLADTFIELAEQDGYEYRIDDGSWQNVTIFWNLEPNTEYVVYQRIRETGEEFASEPSALRIKTTIAGPSARTNQKLVKEYIDNNGFLDENNRPTIAYSLQVDEENVYYFVLTYDIRVKCNTFNVCQGENFLAFDTSFEMPDCGNMFPTCYIQLVQDGYCIDEVEAHADTIYVENYKDFELDVYNTEANYMTDDQISQMVNSTVAMSAGFWDEVLYTELGFGLKGLGFLSYDGYGELFCSYFADFHTGTLVESGYREPGCVIPGKEASLYCSVCNVQVKTGDDIPSKGGHKYDNACDRDCNVCGEQRYTQHVYSFACDTACDNCGAVRTDPLAAHSIGADRLCTKCGHDCLLIGDVNGDGKVNMGDVAKVYAYIRGTSLLTDAGAFTAADTNSDGKINLGDTSSILAHVTGTKRLW